MRAFNVGGARLTVTGVGEGWYAFDDTCTNMGCSLAAGELDGRR